MSEAYSGVMPEHDGSLTVWWRHSDQRPANYIKDMTVSEVRGFAVALMLAADEIDNDDEKES